MLHLSQRLSRPLVCGLAAAVLTACNLGPDYERPTLELPSAYKEAPDWKVATPADHRPRGPWWEVFDDQGLNALAAQVDLSNQTVRIAAANYRQAQTLVQQARAGLFPSLTGTATVVRSQSTLGSGQVPVSGGGPASTSQTLSLSLPWEIDLWGRIARQIEANQASAEASAADLESARLSAQATLAQDYFLLRIADAQKALLERTVAAYTRALEITRNRYAAGVVPRTDVVQADTQLKTARAQAIAVGVPRAQLEHAIAVQIGRPPADLALASADPPRQVPTLPPELPSALLERRPDIASAERQVAAANAQIGVARAAFFPTLTLRSSGGYQGRDLGNLLGAGNRFWSIGPTLTGPLFDAGLRRAQSAQALAAYDASVATYRQTVLTGLQEVEDNLAALRLLAEQSLAQEAAIESARRLVELTMNQYKSGTVSYLNVVTAQAAQFGNERTALDLLGQRLVASVALIKALGGGWQSGRSAGK